MTTFVDRETTVTAAWLNNVDAVTSDPALTALTALTPAADKIPYYTGASAASLADFTTFARTLVAQPSAALALAALGGVPADSPTFTTKLTLGGSGFRFLADFSNATVANRALFQSSTVNGVTSVCATPNGSATTSAWVAYNSSDPANSSYTYLGTTATDARIVTAASGSGANLPLKLYTVNTERMHIGTDGNVGIGMTDPGFGGSWKVLSVRGGSVDSGGVLHLANNDYTVGADIITSATTFPGLTLRTTTVHPIVFQTANVTRMTIADAGNVGIGTTPSANARLLVRSAVDSVVGFQTTSTSCYVNYTSSAGLDATYESSWTRSAANTGDFYFGGNAITTFRWRSNAYAEIMRLTSDGNLSIGGSAPGADLDVNKTKVVGVTSIRVVNPDATAGSGATLDMIQGTVNAGAKAAYGTLTFGTYSNHPLNLKTNSLDRLIIEAAGDVLINHNLKFPNASSRIYTKSTAGPIGERTLFQCHETNAVTVLGAVPNGTATLAAIQCYNNSDLTAPLSYVDIRSGTSAHSITTQSANGGTTLPLKISSGGKPVTFNTTGITDFGSASSDARIKVFQRRDLANQYGLIISAYNVAFENDFFMGQTATGFSLGNYQAFALELKTNNTTRMTLSEDGLVGVGVDPVCKFHVYDPVDARARVSNGTTSTDIVSGGGIGYVGTTTNHPVSLLTNNTTAVYIGADQRVNVGPGGGAASAEFQVTKAGSCELRVTDGPSIFQTYVGGGIGVMGMVGAQPLIFRTNATERFGLESDGRIYTKSIHNNGTVTGTTKQYLCSGTYTPSVTAVSNCSSPSGAKSHWTRVGNVVTVTGRFTVTITAANTVTTARVSLPIASAIASTNDVNGLSMPDNQSVAAYGGVIFGAAATDDAQVNWRSSASTGAIVQHFTFQYEVL